MCPGDEIESRNTDWHLQTINRLTEKLCKNAQQVKDMIPPGCSQTSEDFMTKTTEDSPQAANLWYHGRSVCYWNFPGFYKYKVKAFGLGLFLCTPASVMLPFIVFWFKYGFPWFLCISIIIVQFVDILIFYFMLVPMVILLGSLYFDLLVMPISLCLLVALCLVTLACPCLRSLSEHVFLVVPWYFWISVCWHFGLSLWSWFGLWIQCE